MKMESKQTLEEMYWSRGLSVIEIAENLNNKPDAVYYWFSKYSIPKRDRSTANSLSRLDKDKWFFEEGIWRPRPSEDLYYVLGVMLGDGGYNIQTSYGCTSYIIQLRTADKVFAESFKESLEKIGISGINLYLDGSPKLRHKHWKNLYAVFTSCMLFIDWYRSLALEQIKKEISTERSYAIAFIRGFYESEGNFSLNNNVPCIRIYNKRRQLLGIVKEILECLGFHPTLRRDLRKDVAKRADIVGMYRGEEVQNFMEIVKPCIKTGGV